MPGVAVKAVDVAGGPQIGGHAPWFTVDGQVVVCVGDPVTPHGVAKHADPYMAEGVDWFTIDGIPVCREGNAADCGHPTTGRGWFQING